MIKLALNEEQYLERRSDSKLFTTFFILDKPQGKKAVNYTAYKR